MNVLNSNCLHIIFLYDYCITIILELKDNRRIKVLQDSVVKNLLQCRRSPARQDTQGQSLGSVSGSERSSGEGNSCIQYSCLGKPMDRGAWLAIVYGVSRIWYDLAIKSPPPSYKNTVLQGNFKILSFVVFKYKIH